MLDMPVNDQTINAVCGILNAFETGKQETNYSSIFVYKDDLRKNGKLYRQLTLSRGFVSSGSLKLVLDRYISKGGDLSDFFASYKGKISNEAICDDKLFKQNLIKACVEEDVMKEAQDEIFEEVYLSPAIKFWETNGFKTNLSFAVIADSYLHSGSILDFLRKRFPAKTPSKGGDEGEWISQYLDVRHKWLQNHSNPILNGTVYRTKCFKELMKNGNWELKLPITANGVKIKN